MVKFIKKFIDGSTLEYDEGAFDPWCVYLTSPNKNRYAPKDTEYFEDLKKLSSKYSEAVYDDFIQIYNKTTKTLESEVLNYITELSRKYGVDSLKIDIVFSIIYSGMIAEENKQNTVLGKRIKRLGVHQVLKENISPLGAASFSKGKKCQVLSKECERRGF